MLKNKEGYKMKKEEFTNEELKEIRIGIKRGEKAIAEGRVFTQEEFKERIKKLKEGKYARKII